MATDLANVTSPSTTPDALFGIDNGQIVRVPIGTSTSLVTVGRNVPLTAAQIAAPTAAILADTTATYVGPDGSRYYSDGVALVLFGAVPGSVSYIVPPPTGVAATDTAALAAAMNSGRTLIQLGVGTYLINATATGTIAGKTVRGYSRALTTLKLVDGHALAAVFTPSNTFATDTVFEDFTFDGNVQNCADTTSRCALLRADVTAVITERFKMRRCTLKNGRVFCLRFYPGSDGIEVYDNLFQTWEDVIFESNPWLNFNFHDNECYDYGLNPVYSSATGPVMLVYGGAKFGLGTVGSYGLKVQDNTFIPVKRTPTTVTMTLASPCVVTWTAHGFKTGQRVTFDSTGALYTGLTIGTQYFVITAGLSTDLFQVSTSLGGGAVNTSGSQSGVHTAIAGQGEFALETVTANVYGATITGNTLDNRNTSTSYWVGTGISMNCSESVFDNVFLNGAISLATGYELGSVNSVVNGSLHNGKVTLSGNGNTVSVISIHDRLGGTLNGPVRSGDHIEISSSGNVIEGCSIYSAAAGPSGNAIHVLVGAYSNNAIRGNILNLSNDNTSGIYVENNSGSGNSVDDNIVIGANAGIRVHASSGAAYVRNNTFIGPSGAGGGALLGFSTNTAVISYGNTLGAKSAAVSGTGTVSATNLSTGALIFTGGAGTQTLPPATDMATRIAALQGTIFDFTVDNTAGSGTCTIAVNTGIVAAVPIITGGATLTIANSATQGIAQFRLVFSSATAAVLYRMG